MTAVDSSPLAMFGRIAEAATLRFAGRNLRVRKSSIVHAVRAAPWLASLTLPAPACGQGWSGTGVGELHPVAEPVTCGHCLASAEARAAAADPDRSQQMMLPIPVP